VGDIVTGALKHQWLKDYEAEITGIYEGRYILKGLRTLLGNTEHEMLKIIGVISWYERDLKLVKAAPAPTVVERLQERKKLETTVNHLRGKALLKEQQAAHYRKYVEMKEKELASLAPLTEEKELAELEANYPEFEYMLNLEDEAVKVFVVVDGRLKHGDSVCDPTDEFNPTTGKLIAMKRALGIKFDVTQYGVKKSKPVIKRCFNCKHVHLYMSETPCFDCSFSSNWEASVK
jgi:hypothetical protein